MCSSDLASLLVTKAGFPTVRQPVSVAEGAMPLTVELVSVLTVEEEVVVVASTRTGRRE